jgi:hypothetical protein
MANSKKRVMVRFWGAIMIPRITDTTTDATTAPISNKLSFMVAILLFHDGKNKELLPALGRVDLAENLP